MGYHRAGFDEIVGVDSHPQPHYPFTFVQADALEYGYDWAWEFDAVHASPPCQRYTNAQRIQQREHPDYVQDVRELLYRAAVPYVIENVVGAPLVDPIELCGTMFDLQLYRHRLFESSIRLMQPAHPPHLQRQAKMGRPVQDDEVIQVVGNFSNVRRARTAMGIDWMTRDELREAIPPAYTEYIGRQLLTQLRSQQERSA